MAELDEKLLKALDDRLKNMLTTITSLDSVIQTVVTNSKSSLTDLISLFQASGASLTDMLQAFKGNRLADLLGIKDAAGQVKQLNEQIETLNRNTKMGGKASWVEDEDTGRGSWKVLKGDEFKNEKEERDAINALAEARQKLRDLTLSDSQLWEKIVALINKAATETQREEEARARGLQKASEQQAVLAKSYKEIDEARSIVSGGKKYGELMKIGGEQFKKYEEFSRILTSIREQQDAIEKEWAGSKDRGAEIYKQEQTIANAKREASEAQKQAKQEEARQEKELNKAIKDEEKTKKKDEEDYLGLLKRRNELLEKTYTLTQNLRNANLAEKSTDAFQTRSQSQISSNAETIKKLNEDIKLYEDVGIKLTAEGQQKKEEMEIAHQNKMTNIRLQGEQARQRIEERKTNKTEAESKRYAKEEEKTQRQADAIVRRRTDLEAKVQRIDNDRAIRQQTNSKISQQSIDAEAKEYLTLIARIDQLNNALSKLEGKQAGVTAKAEQRNEPYMNYVAAVEEKRKVDTIDKFNKKLKEQKNTLDSMLPSVQRLASAFGVAFSVRGLAQFGKKLIETRGEFEMQFVAMKQIIGDVDAATKIWNQTMQQALQSPFKAMQLVTYTKQLAAYRIETEKLFDTTKRLADISAGLGVDMQRLILAYGQVKAANFLRASEIRQFTEAGVNVLGELSKYFTEIEGRAVSTAQVMERVTKRMVRFEDVEEIFKRMTDEGGQFFEMQEVQADTVKGQINKLHDAYDQMLNTIGKANQGTLKNMISALNRIIRNWDKIVARLKVITGLFVTYKVAQATAAIQMIKAGKAADAQSLGISGLTARLVNLIAVEKSTTESTLTLSAALKQLNSSKGGWIGVAVSAALTAAIAIADYYKRAHQLSKDLSQITTDTQIRARKSTTDYEQMAEKIRDVNTSEKERQETLSKLKRMYEDILPARMLEIEYITKEGNAYNDAKESIRAYYEEKRKQEALDKVYETYSKDVTDNQEHFASVIADIINKQTGLVVSTREINIVIDELVERFKKGEVNAQNYFEVLNQLLNTQIGVTIDREKLSKTGEGVIETFGDAVKIDEWAKGFLESVLTLDEKLEEAGANATEFGKSIKDALDTKVFDEVEKSIEKDAKALSDATFNEELDFEVSNYEKRAREAFEAFKTTFKEEYDKNPQFFEDQFEIKLKFNLEEKGIQYAKDDIEKQGKAIEHSVIDNQKTINSEIEKLAEQTSISDKEILRQFQVDTSVEFDKWIQNQLSKIDLYKTDLLRIQKGLTSDMTDEHIAMLQTLEPFLPLWEEYLKGLTPAKKTKTTRTTHENASKLISLIKEMRSEYDKLSKSAYGYAKSEEKVRESYKDSVKEILGKAGITDYDFTTNEGMIKALEKVKSYATKLGKDAAAEVQKYIDQLETEIEINAQVRIREDFGKKIENAFNDYELTLELDKLNLPKGLAADMWGIEETDLQDLRNKLSQMFMGLRDENGQLSDEAFKDYEKFLNKIDDLERKQQKERLKDYSKYLEAQYSERVKIEMEYVRKLAALEAETAIKEPQKREIREGLMREFLEKSRKQDWEDFKGSEFYVGMMEDLEKQGSASLEVMRKKLLEMRENAENLSPRALKEVVNALEKIDELEKKRIPPLKRIREEQEKLKGIEIKDVYERIAANQEKLAQDEQEQKDLERMIMLEEERQKLEKQGVTLEEAKARLARSEQALSLILPSLDTRSDGTKEGEERRRILTETVNQAKKEVENWAEIVRILSGQAVIDEQERGSKYGGLSLSDLKKRRDDAKQRIKDLEGLIGKDEELVKAQKDLEDAWNDTWEAAKRWAQSINGIFDGVMDTVGYFSDSTSTLTDGWKEFGDTSISALTDLVSGIQAYQQANAAAKKAGLATGLFTANGLQLAMVILGVIIKIVQAIAKMHDAKIDKEIEQSKKKVDDLQKAYDRLEKSIEKTFDTVSYIREYNQEVQNLNEQIEEANNQIAAAQEYKNEDKRRDAIEAAEDAKQEALDALDEIKQKQIEVFGGIGEDNYRSAAEGFVDAWKSAFLETGDGLQGLQDHFDEFLQDWFTKQLTMKYAAAALKPLFAMMDAAVDQYGPGGVEVIQQELDEMREWAKVYFPQIADELEKNTSIWGLEGEGGLSGLAAGIQGMTEEQANVLEGYWNTVMGNTISINDNVAAIVGLLRDGNGGVGGGKGNIFGDPNVETNPMLKQLDLIAVNTAATHRILESVTKSGHSQGGYGIKVFAD